MKKLSKKTTRPGRKKALTLLCLLMIPVLLTGCVRTTPVGVLVQLMEAAVAIEEDDYSYGNGYTYEAEEDDDWEYDWEDETEESESDEDFSDSYESVRDGEYAQTIMVYMVGSDLESEYGNGSIDLTEMMDSGADTDHNNIVVYAGGAAEWQIDGLSADENSILLLEDDEFNVIDTTDADNMGDPDTLSYFLNYCLDNFESESYSLILWDHGGGPVLGFGIDENYEDLLTLEEIKDALDSSVGDNGTRLEWVGFDACLMNSMEVADTLAPYANYMIASQETEPGWGWNYYFMGELTDKSFSGADMGKIIVDAYMDYGEYIFSEYPRMYSDLTLSCIDLSRYQNAEKALNTFFDELDSSLNVHTFPELVRNRENVRDFGTYSTTFDYGMIDVLHLLESLSPDYRSARDAIDAIDNMIVYSQTNMANAGGISICYPYQTSDEYTEACISIQEEMDFASDYTSFLRDFYAIENGETLAKDWDVTEAETSITSTPVQEFTGNTGSDITLQLTEEQQANYASGGYYILCNVLKQGYIEASEDERADEMYLYIHKSSDVTLDENGTLHAYYNNNAVYMRDAEGLSDIPMILVEKEVFEDEHRYLAYVMLNSYGDDMSDWKIDTAELQIVVNDEYPNGIIRNAIPLADEDDNMNNPSKQLIDLDDYEFMSVSARCSYVTRDENGNLLNFFDWEHSGWMMGFDLDLTQDYSLEVQPLQNPENYVCIFYVKDVQGNVSYSEMIPLQ